MSVGDLVRFNADGAYGVVLELDDATTAPPRVWIFSNGKIIVEWADVLGDTFYAA